MEPLSRSSFCVPPSTPELCDSTTRRLGSTHDNRDTITNDTIRYGGKRSSKKTVGLYTMLQAPPYRHDPFLSNFKSWNAHALASRGLGLLSCNVKIALYAARIVSHGRLTPTDVVSQIKGPRFTKITVAHLTLSSRTEAHLSANRAIRPASIHDDFTTSVLVLVPTCEKWPSLDSSFSPSIGMEKCSQTYSTLMCAKTTDQPDFLSMVCRCSTHVEHLCQICSILRHFKVPCSPPSSLYF